MPVTTPPAASKPAEPTARLAVGFARGEATAFRCASTGFFVLGVSPTLCAGLLKNSYCRTA